MLQDYQHRDKGYDQRGDGGDPSLPSFLPLGVLCGDGQHRLYSRGAVRLFALRGRGVVCHVYLTFFAAAGQQVVHLQAENIRQRLQKSHVGIAEPALPFAYGLVRHMQRLRQRRLRHALLLSPFGDKSAEKLFVQSDHLAAIAPDRRENATDCRFTCIAMAASGLRMGVSGSRSRPGGYFM